MRSLLPRSRCRCLVVILSLVCLVLLLLSRVTDFEKDVHARLRNLSCPAAGFALKGDTIHFHNPENSEGEWRWGNFLSTYYHMLGLAVLGNYNFADSEGFLANEDRWNKHLDDLTTGTWLRYLPRTVPRDPGRPMGVGQDFLTACKSCSWDNWLAMRYPHETCIAQFYIADLIANLTRSAMMRWVATDSNGNESIPIPREGDVTIFLRCNHGSLNNAPNMGLSGFQVYLHAPKTTKRFLLIYEHHVFKNEFPFCSTYLAWLIEFLRHHFPNALIVDKEGTIFNDYATIVFADVVFIEGSSFGLYAALACLGQVYIPPLPQRHEGTCGLELSWLNWVRQCWITHSLGIYLPKPLPDRFHYVTKVLYPPLYVELGWLKASEWPGLPKNFNYSLLKEWLFAN